MRTSRPAAIASMRPEEWATTVTGPRTPLPLRSVHGLHLPPAGSRRSMTPPPALRARTWTLPSAPTPGGVDRRATLSAWTPRCS
ncbi:hypothetical protein ACFU6M_26890 [Streptomyces bottropensis]|uniref:Uncharacterized protein n=1 Tax=Streptomyces bottropensis TaxID=42235 RepID=A0ABU8AUW3_9ACTN